MFKITLTRSIYGIKDKQRATIKALGLRKIGQSVEKPDNEQVRGMLNVVNHLVKVEEK
ncbi:MAG: 50S ribosomal protein L30 [Clostridia bacterium]|jgi:large subunit ribosomal protein L30|nr:50S ribosomal protein L30 [Clostridia bacterium]MBO7504206.1 50S ribosomal protein L30 [Clostridia bacterium]MBO7659854.1 50S ribosomal protein L30 [Clostridia bacterium]MBP5665004.1 50S ribosomal protein L30 [Clostridia bacterium]